MKIKLKDVIAYLIISVCLWIGISTQIQAFKNPKLTQTELLLRVPKSFICDFK